MLIQSESIDLDTPTGEMRTYIHRPISTGKFPVILFYSEIFHQTGPIERAAKIIASHGYAVLVPEVFHELNPIGTVLAYDDAGRKKGNSDKESKDVQSYDSDNQTMIDWVKKQKWSSNQIGAMGFCIDHGSIPSLNSVTCLPSFITIESFPIKSILLTWLSKFILIHGQFNLAAICSICVDLPVP